jgi:hypothetical protein
MGTTMRIYKILSQHVALFVQVYKINFLAAGGETRQIECPDNMYILGRWPG